MQASPCSLFPSPNIHKHGIVSSLRWSLSLSLGELTLHLVMGSSTAMCQCALHLPDSSDFAEDSFFTFPGKACSCAVIKPSLKTIKHRLRCFITCFGVYGVLPTVITKK